ncbi:host specificity protein J [Ferribacterium limneticum]|uniref:host specificity protein J n=1 Tax=Ferribacterium limneticum TaxID=76259 RepID=UPI001CF7F917|nr:phage tail protein [Ferribacterium limneticum]UCV26809.1 host specificity protein J [Ferribacterium limneticum]UCV30726.1 host specificity protein J [Ferribacterium limneticum]
MNGFQSILIDDTPLQNADSSYNFNGFTVETRSGAVVQTHVPGFPATEAVIASSIGEVTAGTPLTRMLIGAYYDAARIMVTVPRLSTQNPTSGDVTGGSVGVQISVNGAVVITDTITGKASSPYSKDYRIELPGDGPWTIQVAKTTPDSDDYNLRDLQWASLTALIDSKFSYPNSALVGITIDASQFSAIPTRAYDMKGLRIRVPKNYDPITRVYATTGPGTSGGIWNGEMKVAWSDNPAWCFYDLLTNPRYGLGEFVPESQVDKANLYAIGKYCDELVPDGYGGQEPRFSCNMYLQTREEAFKVLSDMTGLFAGMLFWASGGLSCTQDAPADAAYQFTNANVIDGLFTYNGSSRSVRHTTALVSYNDPLDQYRRKVEYVEDPEGIERYGIRQAELVAIGCASRGQAHRMGKRILLTERYLTDVVTFKVGLEHLRCYPGAVIKVMDNDKAGARLGGRVKAATLNKITLDKSVTLLGTEAYTLSVIKPDGTIEERGVFLTPGETTELDLTSALSEVPNTQSVWVLASTAVSPQLFKVVSMKELEGITYEITALQYNPSKFAAIDQGTQFEPLANTVTPARPAEKLAAPTGLTHTIVHYIDQNGYYRPRVTIHWDAIGSPYVATYTVSYRYGGGTWRSMPDVAVTEVELEDATPGDYEISVAGVSILGRPGHVSSDTFVVPSIDPTSVYSATTVSLVEAWEGPDLTVGWVALPRVRGYYVRFKVGATIVRQFETPDLQFTYRFAQMAADQSDAPSRTLTVEVEGISPSGAHGATASIVVTNSQMAEAPAPSVDEGVQAFAVTVGKPAKADYAGTIFWASQTSGFTPDDSNKIYEGPATSFLHMGTGSWFFKAAYYDLFGKTGLNISAESGGSSFNAGGLPSVSTLPASPADVGGQQVVYHLVEKKLYRWDGVSAWTNKIDGGDMIPESILAEHIASIDLKAISASVGELETGKMKVDNTGHIRGGQPAFDNGSGFWLGYDVNAYKLSLGNAASDKMTFDENGMVINGNLSIVSNASTPAILNGSFDAGLLNWTTQVAGAQGSWSAANVDTRSCIKFTTPSTYGTSFDTYLYSDKFVVAPGQVFSSTVTFSVDALPLNAGMTITLECSTNPAFSGQYVGTGDISVFISQQDISVVGEWITVALDGLIPPGSCFASLVIYFWGQQGS